MGDLGQRLGQRTFVVAYCPTCGTVTAAQDGHGGSVSLRSLDPSVYQVSIREAAESAATFEGPPRWRLSGSGPSSQRSPGEALARSGSWAVTIVRSALRPFRPFPALDAVLKTGHSFSLRLGVIRRVSKPHHSAE